MASHKVEMRRDFDDKWALTWPAEVVSTGGSAGVGRHETRRGLIAAMESAGWSLTQHDGQWKAER